MGAATVVASAIVFSLVIIIAYIMMGTSLQMIDVVSSAQSEMTESQEERLRSSIEIYNSSIDTLPSRVYVYITNSGSETLKDFKYWDVYIIDTISEDPVLCTYTTESSGNNVWNITNIWPDYINPGLLDPEENASITIWCQNGPSKWVKITTPTGVSDSWFVL